MADLKPCPFCGGKAATINVTPTSFAVGCFGVHGSICPGYLYKCSPLYYTEECAVEAWNRRHDKTPEEKQEERKQKKREYNRKYRETHKEHDRQYQREWRKKNPEKVKEQKLRARQRRNNNGTQY